MKKYLLSVIVLLNVFSSFSQTDTTIHLYLAHDSLIVHVDDSGDYIIPTFCDSSMNAISKKYTFKVFRKEDSISRFLDMQHLYTITCNNTHFAEEISTSFPNYFACYGITPPPESLGMYTPNDWHAGSYSNPWALDYIYARNAWGLGLGGCKGNPEVIIGITDTYFGLDHPDLFSKIAFVDNNILPSSFVNHGSFVAGMAAAHTDNSIGYSGVAFNCKLRVSSIRTSLENKKMTLPGPYKARVLNVSWGAVNIGTSNLEYNTSVNLGQRLNWNDIYENGVSICVAAGNGTKAPSGNFPWYYVDPASWDHVISTTHIGNRNCNWVEDGPQNDYNCDEHNIIHGDTTADGYVHNNYNHNTRVDVCAPSDQVGGLIYDLSKSGDSRYYSSSASGTSFASPMTAGAVALMISVNDMLSPYQIEWLLKQTCRGDIYSVPDNAYFAAPKRLGAGALQVEHAVAAAAYYDVNTLETQTFHIEGIDVNTLCAPGTTISAPPYSSNGVKPQLSVKLKNGTPPYTYMWENWAINNTTLDDYSSPNPTIVTSNSVNVASYYLTVWDNSPVQKVAHKRVRLKLRTDNTYQLASRDSYVDMMDEPNGQELVDPRDWHYWASPDVWNRHLADGNTTPQDVEYFSNGDPNYAYVRIRNVGCAAYPNTDNAQVHLYWTLQSTGESWPTDWTSAYVPAEGGGWASAGKEITSMGALQVPDLLPGETFVGYRGWQPPNPATYEGSPSSVYLCYLSRLGEPARTQYGMFTV